MKDPQSTTVSGTVRDIFAHRFVLQTEAGSLLADLGPRGLDMLRLAVGDAVTITGERKPSELKVSGIERDGRRFEIPHGDTHHAAADPEVARRAAAAAGLETLGDPRRKPKHFEVLGRDAGGKLVELHVEIDGRIRKSRQVDATEEKWAAALASA